MLLHFQLPSWSSFCNPSDKRFFKSILHNHELRISESAEHAYSRSLHHVREFVQIGRAEEADQLLREVLSCQRICADRSGRRGRSVAKRGFVMSESILYAAGLGASEGPSACNLTHDRIWVFAL